MSQFVQQERHAHRILFRLNLHTLLHCEFFICMSKIRPEQCSSSRSSQSRKRPDYFSALTASSDSDKKREKLTDTNKESAFFCRYIGQVSGHTWCVCVCVCVCVCSVATTLPLMRATVPSDQDVASTGSRLSWASLLPQVCSRSLKPFFGISFAL